MVLLLVLLMLLLLLVLLLVLLLQLVVLLLLQVLLLPGEWLTCSIRAMDCRLVSVTAATFRVVVAEVTATCDRPRTTIRPDASVIQLPKQKCLAPVETNGACLPPPLPIERPVSAAIEITDSVCPAA